MCKLDTSERSGAVGPEPAKRDFGRGVASRARIFGLHAAVNLLMLYKHNVATSSAMYRQQKGYLQYYYDPRRVFTYYYVRLMHTIVGHV